MTTTEEFAVTGMTCAHCVAAVTEEITALPGVVTVAVDLQPEGVSTVAVVSETAVSYAQIATALDEAGEYHLAAPAVSP